MSAKRAKLVLADGLEFEGESFGAEGERLGEVVFNTSLFGYQEILTDPSYVGQILCMTNPEIGNTGVNAQDDESAHPHPVGFAVRNLTREPSNWRSEGDLSGYLAKHGVVGIAGIDTRALVKHLRTTGAQMGIVTTENATGKALAERARTAPGMEGQDLASGISCKAPYVFTEGSGDPLREGHGAPPAARLHVVAYDFGLKKAMVRLLVDRAGRVWQARPLVYQGAHVKHYNEHNLGIVLLGNFNIQRPSAAQATNLAAFVAFLRQLYALAPDQVFMHRELGHTDCPGDSMVSIVERMRGKWLRGDA